LTQTSEILQSALHRAHYDSLTGLANRTLFEESVHQALSLAKRTGASVAVLYIDLDDFKAVNDAFGHAAGDELLRIAAQRLKATLRESDVGARLGGDEFAVLLPNTGAEGAEKVAVNLVEALGLPYGLPQRVVHLSASIGMALYPQCASTAEELLHRADLAMYDAKAAGRARHVVASARSDPQAASARA
jgi:diguanylate cyclase (GGDEF)-like protein